MEAGYNGHSDIAIELIKAKADVNAMVLSDEDEVRVR